MTTQDFADISTQIWDMKYRYKSGGACIDETVDDTWRRVAKAVAGVEKDPAAWEDTFYDLLEGYKFLPGGRILANAGTSRDQTTMFNCYVMNTIPDSMNGIFDVVKESALTQKQGGGVGFDFSTIRPKGDHITGVDSEASGPISFMHVLDATCRTIMSAGQRRGAQMAMLRCDHPDIEEFIVAKRENAALKMFNLSVAVTDAFVDAVKHDRSWDLVFEDRIYKTVQARELWDKIMDSTYNWAEPGVIFIDRINKLNNLYYCETICATNPCGEQPLPPYGACLLGSVNLTRFVKDPFSKQAKVDFDGLKKISATAVRFLDNVIDLSNYPLPEQAEEAQRKRRMGIGITGLANLFMFMGIRYGSHESVELAEKIMKTIRDSAYAASAKLAKEKGSFPLLEADKYADGAFVKQLPKATRDAIRKDGIRNSHLISIAPTGTISLYAGNVSSGLEPVFALHYTRRIRKGDETDVMETEVFDYAYNTYVETFGRPENDLELPDYFVSASDINPREHVLIQAALQHFVDSSISKTINVPEDCAFEDFKDIYMFAFERGLKGCTTFRPSANLMGVLVKKDDKKQDDQEDEKRIPEDVIVSRPYVLEGITYKIKTPLSSDALYLTINDIIEDDKRRPYELFINTKNLQHFSWIVAMTRLISAVFRREKDPSFLVDELKSIYDPNGGYFAGGKYIPSLAADIGRIIEEHLAHIGLIERPNKQAEVVSIAEGTPRTASEESFTICPNCNEKTLYYQENCMKCTSCLYSKCG